MRHSMYRPEFNEIVRNPEWMLNDLENQGYMEGDCDDLTTMTAALCHSLGVQSRIVAVRTNMLDPEFDHVFLEIPTSIGTAYRLDTTVFPHVHIPEAERIVEYV